MFTDVPNLFTSKGNSFYSFHNQKDDLKGGLQFSINWFVHPPESMSENEALLNFIEANEKNKIDCQTVRVSNYQAIYFSKSCADSNMEFCYWYIYHDKILITITHMIFEEETDEIKGKWLKRVTGIVNSLELNVNKFKTTLMK
jgi:hypothetical protein